LGIHIKLSHFLQGISPRISLFLWSSVKVAVGGCWACVQLPLTRRGKSVRPSVSQHPPFTSLCVSPKNVDQTFRWHFLDTHQRRLLFSMFCATFFFWPHVFPLRWRKISYSFSILSAVFYASLSRFLFAPFLFPMWDFLLLQHSLHFLYPYSGIMIIVPILAT